VAPTTPDKKSVTAKLDRNAIGPANRRDLATFIEMISDCFASSNMLQRSPEVAGALLQA
jgi:hypothetical protein